MTLVENSIEEIQSDMKELKNSLQQSSQKLKEEYTLEQCNFEELSIKPKRKDIINLKVALLWEGM